MNKWRGEQSSSKSERVPLRHYCEGQPYDGSSYDSFETPEDIESDFLNNALEGIEDEDNSKESIDKSFEQDLKNSLPSAELRKIHALARGGTLKQIILKPRESIDAFDGDHEPQASSSSTAAVQMDDTFSHEEEYLQIDPAEMENIRDMTTTMDRKKSVRIRLKDRHDRPLSGWQNFKFERAMRWKKLKSSMKDTFSSFDIWKGHLKEVEGLFGTGVLSYFTFLRWLLYINLMVCLLTLSFLLVPQIIHEQSVKSINETFNGLELLTGEGWFAHTELFYGRYTNEKVKDRYDMKYAYLFVGGGYMVMCIMALAVSIANSYKENFIETDDKIATFSSKLFCSWDFGMSNEETAKIKMKSIAQDILETLGSERGKVKASCCSRFALFMLRLFTNLVVLALMAGSAYLIYFVSQASVKENFGNLHEHHLAKAMYPAIAISVVNFVIPTGFRLIASIESYHFPQTELSISLTRTIVLKLASLVVYVVTLFIQLDNVGSTLQNSCWENFVGQAFYKLVIVDFIAVMLTTFFEEFIRKLFAKHVGCCKMHLPGFDISKNVLNLIYSQGICWLGTFYCPLLPVINVLKLFVTFYVKKTSLVRNCRPSLRPFKASKMLVWFLCLLSLMLVLTLLVIGYIIMDESTLKPSVICGPFRGQESIYSLVLQVIEELPKTLKNIVNVISSLSVLAAIIFLIGLLAYYFRMRKVSSEKKIKLLKQQLSLAGQDKQFLIAKLRQIMRTDPHVN